MARRLVGLDIGSSGVRAAEFSPGRRPRLRRAAALPLDPGVVRAGLVVDGEALTERLRELWSLGHFSTRSVRLGIANAGVLVRQMDLDWMPPRDMRDGLRYQVGDDLPIPLDEANLDYHLIEELEVPDEHGNPRRISRIMLVAAARDAVDGFTAAVQAARLRPVSVDLVPFALVRARSPRGADPARGTEAIVDIGFDMLTVVVHSGGVPRYVRMVPGMGGEHLTEALQRTYGWERDEAERTKVYAALPGHARLTPDRLGYPTPPAGFEHPAQRTVSAAVQELADEIASTLDYYQARAPEPRPVAPGRDTAGELEQSSGVAVLDAPDRADHALTEVVLTGSGSRLGGLADLLTDRLGIPTTRLDLGRQIRRPRHVHVPGGDLAALAVPTGLCVGGAR